MDSSEKLTTEGVGVKNSENLPTSLMDGPSQDPRPHYWVTFTRAKLFFSPLLISIKICVSTLVF